MAVRRLIEQTTLSQHQIAAKTGVKRATISVWQKNYGWERPPLAPRAPDSVPLWRAGPGLKLRLLCIVLARRRDPHRAEERRRGGVDFDRAPREALDLVTDAYTPPEDG